MPYEFENKSLFTSAPLKTAVGQKLEDALVAYYKKGWKCIPCRLEIDSERYKDSKKHADFGISTVDRKYRRWGQAVLQLDHQVDALRLFHSATKGLPANALAIVTGKVSNLFILDKDAPLDKANKYLSDAGIQVYADNFTVVSPNGGEHIYFEYDPILDGMPSTSAKFFGKDSPIDIRSNGGLIFVPPSCVYNKDINETLHYRFYTNPDEPGRKYKLHKIPGTLISMITKRHADRKTNETINLEGCTKNLSHLSPKQLLWLNKDIETCKNAEKGTRSEKCFALVCTCLKLKLDQETIKGICLPISRFAERSDYLARLLTDAAAQVDASSYDYTAKKYNIGADGRIIKPILGSPVLPEQQRLCRPPMSEQQMSDIVDKVMNRDKNLKSLQWLVPNFMANKMVGIFIGPPGIGKTVSLMDCCNSITQASELFGCISVKDKSKVLYIQFELAENVFLDNYIKRMNMDKNKLFEYVCKDSLRQEDGVTLTLDRENVEGRLFLEQFILKSDAKLVVIDSLKHCFAGDLNKSEVMSELLMWLKGVASRHDKSIMIVHHLRKRSMLKRGEIPADYSLDDMAGSGTIASTVDFAIAVNEVFDETLGTKIEKTGKVCIVKQGSIGDSLLKESTYQIKNSFDKFGDQKVAIVYNSKISSEISPDSFKHKIISKLYNSPKWSSKILFEQIGGNSDVSLRTFYNIMDSLVADGFVSRIGKTRNQFVTLTTKGKEFYKTSNVELVQEVLTMGDSQEEQNKQHRVRALLLLMFDVTGEKPCPIRPSVEALEEEYIEILDPEWGPPRFKDDLDYLVDKGYMIPSFDEDNISVVVLSVTGKVIFQKLYPQFFKKEEADA